MTPLDKLKATAQLITESLTRKEFVEAFTAIRNQVKELRQSNETEWTLVYSAAQIFQKKIAEDNAADLANLKKEFSDLFTPKLAEIAKEHKSRMAEVDAKLLEVDAKMAEVHNGEDAVVDEAKIAADVRKLITIPEELTGDEIILKINGAEMQIVPEAVEGLKDVIEKLKKGLATGTKVGWGAHPLTIAQSGTIKAKTARYINFTGSGVSSVTQNSNGTIDVSISGGGGGGSVSVYSETPGGLINGSNTTYTTLNNITTVIRVTLNGEDIDPSQYSTSGSGFTMGTAIPASFSGTPFTIVYSSGTSSSTSFYTDAVSGIINGSNTAFTVANTITTPMVLFLGGVPYQPTVDFTTSTTNITMLVAPDATLSGQPFFLLHT